MCVAGRWSKRKCCKIGPNQPKGSIEKGGMPYFLGNVPNYPVTGGCDAGGGAVFCDSIQLLLLALANKICRALGELCEKVGQGGGTDSDVCSN